MLPYLKRTLTITLDTDWLWRRLLPALAVRFEALLDAAGRARSALAGFIQHGVVGMVVRQADHDARLARTWSTRSMALWVLVLLLGYLLLYYA